MQIIARDIKDLLGNTPMVCLDRLTATRQLKAKLLAKLEAFNPGGSIKDRVAFALLEDAEKRGVLLPGAVVIEPTSGNTGVGLALACSLKGYRLIITMSESMSIERRKLIGAYGAEIVLTPAAQGMNGAIARAEQLASEIPGAFMPKQFENPANSAIHYQTTGPEIWSACPQIDVFVAGVGTGGTITGIGKFLKEQNPKIEIVAVEPASSPVLSGGLPGSHTLQGIGAGFVPAILELQVIDRILPIENHEAEIVARELAQAEAILAGYSSGAAVAAALKIAALPGYQDKTLVVVLPDGGERYLSTTLF